MSDDRPHGQRAEMDTGSGLGWLYDQITGDEDARVCKDIPDAACHHQPRNFFAYLVSNALTKVADELASARLVLPWLLSALGAPSTFAGFLVPIREAGVLLPQLVVAAYIRRLPRRSVVWLTGAFLSAASLGLMALSTVTLSGPAAGWAIVGLVVVFSLARGLCSVSAKDVLGKTVSKTRRGRLMGYSTAAAGVATLLLGIYIESASAELQSEAVFFGFLAGAALLWLAAAAIFAGIHEVAGATEGGGNAFTAAVHSLRLLRTDRHFRQFVVNRGLLLSVALAPPFFVILAQRHSGDSLTGLGMLIIASGVAASLSAPVWGRLSDQSSRQVMTIGAAIAGSLGVLTWALIMVDAAVMRSPLTYAVLFLLLAVAHSGVRLGRKVYLVDMSTTETRSAYVALSNTVIGAAMLVGGAFGVIGDLLDPSYVVLALGGIALIAALYSSQLPEVSG